MSDNRGRSTLGLCHPRYNLNRCIESFKGASVIRFGWLDLFFGQPANATTMMRLERPKFCRIHIINGPGMNNGRTQPHEITYKETTQSVQRKVLDGNQAFLKAFESRCLVVRQVCNAAPPGTLELAVSPWLEHQNLDKRAFDRLAAICNRVFPEAAIVDNPVGNVPLFQGYIHEKHGIMDNPNHIDIVDLDGVDFEQIDLLAFGKKYQNCKVCYMWGLGENGVAKDEPWKPPQKRVNWSGGREALVYKDFMQPGALVEQSPLNPLDLKGVRVRHNPSDGWKRQFTWKLGEGKNHATVLFPREMRRFKNVQVFKNGQRVDVGRYRGIYSHDGSGRMIYDFSKHTSFFADNSVLVADGHGWVLNKAVFRID